jgi:hypothetical protein
MSKRTRQIHPQAINVELPGGGDANIATEEGRLHFVMHTWPSTAGLAYKQYTIQGRGAVLLRKDDKGDKQDLIAKYVTKFEGDSEEWSKGIDHLIATYDPEKVIIVVFDLGDTRIFGPYHLDLLPPPQAYEWIQEKQRKEILGGIDELQENWDVSKT